MPINSRSPEHKPQLSVQEGIGLQTRNLFSAISRERGTNSKVEWKYKGEAKELVRRATEERFDMMAIFELFVPAAKALIQSQGKIQEAAAKVILEETAKYVERQGVGVKTFLPPDSLDSTDSYEAFYKLIGEADLDNLLLQVVGCRYVTVPTPGFPGQTMKVLNHRKPAASPLALPGFWEGFLIDMLAVEQDHRKIISDTGIYASNRTNNVSEVINQIINKDITTLQTKEVSEVADKLLQTAVKESLVNQQPARQGRMPDRQEGLPYLRAELDRLFGSHLAPATLPMQHPEGFAPNIYEIKFGGVSMKDIVAEPFGDGFVDKVLTFVANMPKGNVFWQKFAQIMFFEQRNSEVAQDYAKLSFPDFAKNVAAFQLRITSDLVSPLFPEPGQAAEQNKLDAKLFAALRTIYPVWSSTLADTVFTTAINMPAFKNALAGNFSQEEMAKIHPLDMLASASKPEESRQVIAATLIKGLPELLLDWRKRMQQTEKGQQAGKANVEAFFSHMSRILNADYVKHFSAPNALDFVMRLIPRERRYDGLVEDINVVQRFAHNLLPESAIQALGIHSNDSYNFYAIKVSENSPIFSMLGYRMVTIALQDNPTQPVLFSVLGRDKEHNIAGVLAPDGKITHVFSQTPAAQQAFAQSITAEAFKVLLQALNITDHPILRIPPAEFEPKELTPEEREAEITPESAENVFGDMFFGNNN